VKHSPSEALRSRLWITHLPRTRPPRLKPKPAERSAAAIHLGFDPRALPARSSRDSLRPQAKVKSSPHEGDTFPAVAAHCHASKSTHRHRHLWPMAKGLRMERLMQAQYRAALPTVTMRTPMPRRRCRSTESTPQARCRPAIRRRLHCSPDHNNAVGRTGSDKPPASRHCCPPGAQANAAPHPTAPTRRPRCRLTTAAPSPHLPYTATQTVRGLPARPRRHRRTAFLHGHGRGGTRPPTPPRPRRHPPSNTATATRPATPPRPHRGTTIRRAARPRRHHNTASGRATRIPRPPVDPAAAEHRHADIAASRHDYNHAGTAAHHSPPAVRRDPPVLAAARRC
jgi:hypothetical protein